MYRHRRRRQSRGDQSQGSRSGEHESRALLHAPVLLAADIDRGGIFAALVGTMELLERGEGASQGVHRQQISRDVSLLKPGLDWLEARTGYRSRA